MGILPLQFLAEENPDTLGLTGEETYDIIGLPQLLATKFAGGRQLTVRATAAKDHVIEFDVQVRIDTPQEILYYEHGGILQYVLRQLLAGKQ
jgi:aconitate hydratase